MPTLHWIGKDKVQNHHLDVPLHILEKQYNFPQGSEEDKSPTVKLIKGDNLLALKALIPQYEGKIKCIYIDPPYNTGNEGWVYNDAVNDPKIKRWLGQVVGKEAEDLSRHDKWLCMMYPRLKLLHKLLAEDGVIFVSIDDNEQAHLKLAMDEIFGRNEFIGTIIWKSRQNKDNRNINRLSNDHEYVLAFGGALKGEARSSDSYTNPDNDERGPWASANLVGLLDEKQRPNLHFDLINPATGINYGRPKMGWRNDPKTMDRLIKENLILWPSYPEGRPRRKKFLNELSESSNGFSSVIEEKIFTRDGTIAIQELFGERSFEFPKPPSLVELLIEQVAGQEDIILDSFAGSGTTAHAVLNLNKKDGGNRQCILVEMEDYVESITAERVKRVMVGYGEGTKTVEGTGGSFAFSELGPRLFHPDGNLNEEVPLEEIHRYVWWSETRSALSSSVRVPTNRTDDVYFLGLHQETAYYFYYEKEAVTTLDEAFLSQIRHKASQYVIYADELMLSQNGLRQLGIAFKKIPRDIHLI